MNSFNQREIAVPDGFHKKTAQERDAVRPQGADPYHVPNSAIGVKTKPRKTAFQQMLDDQRERTGVGLRALYPNLPDHFRAAVDIDGFVEQCLDRGQPLEMTSDFAVAVREAYSVLPERDPDMRSSFQLAHAPLPRHGCVSGRKFIPDFSAADVVVPCPPVPAVSSGDEMAEAMPITAPADRHVFLQSTMVGLPRVSASDNTPKPQVHRAKGVGDLRREKRARERNTPKANDFAQKVAIEHGRTGSGLRRVYRAMDATDQARWSEHTVLDWTKKTPGHDGPERVLAFYRQLPALKTPVSLEEDISLDRFNHQDVLMVDSEVARTQILSHVGRGRAVGSHDFFEACLARYPDMPEATLRNLMDKSHSQKKFSRAIVWQGLSVLEQDFGIDVRGLSAKSDLAPQLPASQPALPPSPPLSAPAAIVAGAPSGGVPRRINMAQLRGPLSEAFAQAKITPDQIYRAMPLSQRANLKLDQVQRWFDPEVPVAMAARRHIGWFAGAAIRLIEEGPGA